MSGVAWAALSGVGFGFFQSLNARAVKEIGDAYTSTFLQLITATLVLACIALPTEGVAPFAGASAWALCAFVLAGLTHFFLGWTTMNLSQQRIGAARTSPILATTPVFGLLFAAVLIGELPGKAAVVGIGLSVAGAHVVSGAKGSRPTHLTAYGYALATAAAWALSPVLTVEGLETLESPLLGVTVGLFAATLAYGALILITRTPLAPVLEPSRTLWLKLVAGAIAALATWWRWVSLDDAAVAVVLALNLLSVPVVLTVAPVVSGSDFEVVNTRVWVGAALVIAGALLLISQG